MRIKSHLYCALTATIACLAPTVNGFSFVYVKGIPIWNLKSEMIFTLYAPLELIFWPFCLLSSDRHWKASTFLPRHEYGHTMPKATTTANRLDLTWSRNLGAFAVRHYQLRTTFSRNHPVIFLLAYHAHIHSFCKKLSQRIRTTGRNREVSCQSTTRASRWHCGGGKVHVFYNGCM